MVALDGDLGPAMAAPAGSISVVICTQDSGRHDGLLEGIASLAAQTRAPHEVVVIVDHNPELSRRLAAGGLGARIVDNPGESGLSGARNAGLNEATGEIVAYLDDDATAEPQWLAELAAAFDDPRIIAAGGRAGPAGSRTSSVGSSAAPTAGCPSSQLKSATSSAATWPSVAPRSRRWVASAGA
jgi:glycosyltransferase involved in cell wall biosynthesis